MHVSVLGPGAVGSMFGGHLARAGVDVTLVGRPGPHVDALNDGLRLTLPDGHTETVDVAVTTDPAAAAPADVVLVCVKSYDTEDALSGARELLADADVCTFQNGLGNAETIAEFVPRARVLAGTTSHGATLEAPGHVRHAGYGDTRVGRFFAENDDRVRALALGAPKGMGGTRAKLPCAECGADYHVTEVDESGVTLTCPDCGNVVEM